MACPRNHDDEEEDLTMATHALSKLDLLDEEALKERILSMIEERDKTIKLLVERMIALVREVKDALEQLVTRYDTWIMHAYEGEVKGIKEAEEEQERMRVQIVQFMQATTLSFNQIFQHQSPS